MVLCLFFLLVFAACALEIHGICNVRHVSIASIIVLLDVAQDLKPPVVTSRHYVIISNTMYESGYRLDVFVFLFFG